jgi:hypothetical protein
MALLAYIGSRRNTALTYLPVHATDSRSPVYAGPTLLRQTDGRFN